MTEDDVHSSTGRFKDTISLSYASFSIVLMILHVYRNMQRDRRKSYIPSLHPCVGAEKASRSQTKEVLDKETQQQCTGKEENHLL